MGLKITDVTWAKIVETIIAVIILVFLVMKLFVFKDVIDIGSVYEMFR